MKIHRFIGDFDLSEKIITLTDPALVRQLFLVLKIQVGEKISLVDKNGLEVLTTVAKADKSKYVVEVGNKLAATKIRKQVTLYCAILKKENFDLVVQKATEIGVSKIVPLITERTIKLNVNLERLSKIAQEASEQSGRNSVLKIVEPMSFKETIPLTKNNDLNLFCQMDGKKMSEIQKKLEESKTVGVWIGPEGGWSKNEIYYTKLGKFTVVSLSKNVLRGETAAIIGSFLACE